MGPRIANRHVSPIFLKPAAVFAFAFGLCLMAAAGGQDGYVPDSRAISPDSASIRRVMRGEISTAYALWWGFDPLDCTETLQAAINSAAKEIVITNQGVPWISGPLKIGSNKTLIFQDKVVLSAAQGKFRGKFDNLLSITDKSNIVLKGYGAVLEMRKREYLAPPYDKSEWRHCIGIRAGHNVQISGFKCINSGGDGIFVGDGLDSLGFCTDITVRDFSCDSALRQGASVSAVENLLFSNCTFTNTSGTPPESGIDFEPDASFGRLINCRLENCKFEHNAGYGIIVSIIQMKPWSRPISIVIDGCRSEQNRYNALLIAGAKGVTQQLGYVHINNTYLDDGLRTIDGDCLTIDVK